VIDVLADGVNKRRERLHRHNQPNHLSRAPNQQKWLIPLETSCDSLQLQTGLCCKKRNLPK
jgi:hypothetical protein